MKTKLDGTELANKIDVHLQNQTQNNFIFFLNKSVGLFFSYLLYLIGFAALGFAFIADRVFPFQILNKIQYSENVINAIGSKGDSQTFVFAVRGLIFLLGIFIIYIAYLSHKLTVKNSELKKSYDLLKYSSLHISNTETKPTNELPTGTTLKPLEAKDLDWIQEDK